VGLVSIRNLTRGSMVARCAEVADARLRRLLGLMGRTDWARSDGLLVRPCSGVHTFFLRVPIDVVFASREGVVLDLVPARAPWRLGPVVWRSRWVLELPSGAIEGSGTRLDDRLIVEGVADRSAG
jgi:uncharacterized membrane protein (UPF0127 family)